MSGNQIALAGYAKIISHVLGFLHSSFVWLHRHKNVFQWGLFCCLNHRQKKQLWLN